MIEERVEVVINVPAEEAFRFVSDPRSELAWNRFAVRIEKLSAGPNRKGSRHRGTYSGAGTFDLEVTEYKPDMECGYSGRSALLAWDQTDQFEAIDAHSIRLRRWMAGYFKGPMRLLEPLMGRAFKARFRGSAELIKESIESGRAEAFLEDLRSKDGSHPDS